MANIQIVEMGLRDGLQNEAVHLSVSQRFQLLKKLSAAGLRRIEIGAFVSPHWVPQMSATPQMVKKALKAQSTGQLPKNHQFSTLVPNMKGLENALKTEIKEIAIFGAVTESFSQKNINVSVKQSLMNFEKVVKEAKKNKLKVRAYISTVFGCPYEGKVSQAKAIKLVEKYL
ncbi:MAG: hydroxymethylglutaryl-CoA lyase, partial [Bdellovibrionales bacterium]|nr:hydroxymethylglutaryl-CoA lyase [Bdellovibrionales bacterium]